MAWAGQSEVIGKDQPDKNLLKDFLVHHVANFILCDEYDRCYICTLMTSTVNHNQ